MKQHEKHIIGGRKIGKGGKNCVVKPAVKCLEKDSMKNVISKLIKQKDFHVSEKKINKILKKIDKNKKYFIHNKKYCQVKTQKLLNRKQKDFKLTNKYDNLFEEYEPYCRIEPDTNYINIIQEYGGHTLNDLIQSSKLHNLQPYLLKSFTHLLKALELLHNNGIIHRDIKVDNIILKNHLPRIIDFNNAIEISQVKEILPVVGNYYYNIPLDNLMLNAIDNAITKGESLTPNKNTEIKKYCLSKYKNIIVLPKNDEIIDNLLIAMIKKIRSPEFLKYYKTEYLQKVDIYSLGILFKMILQKLNIKGKKLNKMVSHMIKLNPDDRWDIISCLNYIS